MRVASKVGFLWVLFMGIFFPVAANAYTTMLTNFGNPYRWNKTHIQWYLHPSGCADLSFEKTRAAIQAAFDSWEAISCSDMTFEYAGSSTSNVPGAIHIYFDPAFSFQGTDGALAYGGPSTGVVFNETYEWTDIAVNGQGNLQDLQAVATHELGHVLGLSHTTQPNATMYFVGGAMNERNLSDDDRKGLCFLYPAPNYFFTEGEDCDACSLDSQCLNGACMPHPWEGGRFCAQNCTYDSQCSIGYNCVSSHCMPNFQYCTQAGFNIPFGEYCWGHETCSTNYCFSSGKGQYDAFCVAFCDQGQSCPANSECAYDSLCIPMECDPVQDLGCPIGRRCLWYNKQAWGPGGDSVTGRCVDENDGGDLGAACGDALPGCQPDLTCVYIDWLARSQCVSDCRLPSGLGCTSSSSCFANEQSGHPERGFCVPKEPSFPNSDLLHVNDAGQSEGLDGGSDPSGSNPPNLPGAPNPPKPEHPGSSSLCSSHPRDPKKVHSGLWFLLVCAVLVHKRRIKKPSPD